MKVDPEEILFMKDQAPKGFPRLVQEGLEAQGIVYRREFIYSELGSIKKSYNASVITEARRLLKAIKGVEYKSTDDE